MMVLLLLLWWVVFTALFAVGQGLLMPAIRRTPKGAEANRQSFALHWLFGAVWALPLVFTPQWHTVVMALLVRVSLFDVVCNLAAGDTPFYVGQTAKTDRLLQWIAAKIGVSASVVNAVLKLISLLFLLGVLWINN